MERRLSAFYDRVAYPLITDLRVAFPGLEVSDVYPRDLGHLYRGGQLFVVGRYRGSGAHRIRLTGRASHERRARTFSYDVAFPAAETENDWLPRLWATRKIGFLLDEIRLRGEHPELRTEVVSLARTFGVVTPYTSFLVVEDQAIPPGIDDDRRAANAPGGGRPIVPDAPAPESEPAVRAFEGFDGATSVYDFEDESLEGDLDRPDGERLAVRRPAQPGSGATSSSRAPSGGAGARGRAISRQLRAMREAEQSRAATTRDTRFVAGRTFRSIRGMWVDAAYRRGMPSLRVRYASPAYFALLRARPSLRRFFALGQRVTVVLAGGRAVIVDENAPAGVSAADVTRFLSGGPG
jgi:Ca-activated chloride channel family protein